MTEQQQKALNESMFMTGGNTKEQKDYYALGFKAGLSFAQNEPEADESEIEQKQSALFKIHDKYRGSTAGSMRIEAGEYGYSLACEELEAKDKEIKRLKELIETAFSSGYNNGYGDSKHKNTLTDPPFSQFAKDNKL